MDVVGMGSVIATQPSLGFLVVSALPDSSVPIAHLSAQAVLKTPALGVVRVQTILVSVHVTMAMVVAPVILHVRRWERESVTRKVSVTMACANAQQVGMATLVRGGW